MSHFGSPIMAQLLRGSVSSTPAPAPAFDELTMFEPGVQGFYFDPMAGLANTTIGHDGSGGTPTSGSGDIGRLIDLSGATNGKTVRHLQQSSASLKPRANTYCGRTCVDFSTGNADSWIGFGDDVFDGRSSAPGFFYAFLAFLTVSNPNLVRFIHSDPNRSADLASVALGSGGLWMQDQDGGSPLVGNVAATDPARQTWFYGAGVWSPTTGQSSLRLNGGTAVTGSTNGLNFPLGIRLGKYGPQLRPNIAIGAMIARTGIPSAALQNALAAKWMGRIGL